MEMLRDLAASCRLSASASRCRYSSRLVLISHDTSVRDANTDPFMGTIVLRPVRTGLRGDLPGGRDDLGRLLHWTGELLLISGVLPAAKGISDVRREWTRLPVFEKSVILRGRSARDSVVSFLWLCWNRRLEAWPWLARLGLRIHHTHIHGEDVIVSAEAAQARAEARVGRVVITGGETDQRLAQLEKRGMTSQFPS